MARILASLVLALALGGCAQSTQRSAAPSDRFPAIQLVRTPMFEGQRELRGYSLYAYLLSGHASDTEKWTTSLSAYLCNPPPAGASGSPSSQTGSYIVPLKKSAADYRADMDGATLLGAYDTDRAERIIADLVAAQFIPPSMRRADSIYLAVFDRPYQDSPTQFAIYDLGGLLQPADVKDWLVAASLSIENGTQAATHRTTRVRPSFAEATDYLGQTVLSYLVSPAKAQTLACH